MKRIGLFALAIVLAGCGGNQTNTSAMGGTNFTPKNNEATGELAAKAFLTKGTGAKAISANNDFGFKLLKLAAKEEGNILLSPVSLTSALAMTMNGAAGDTKTAMQKALQIEKLRLQDINESYKLLREALRVTDTKVEIRLANSLWASKGNTYKPDFLKINRNYFQAHVGDADIATKEGVDAVNKWVTDQTSGRIKKMLDEPNRDLAFVLLNAVYFRGDWDKAFNADNTKPEEFTPAKGDAVQLPFMHQTGSYAHAETEGFEAVRLPYGDKHTSMVILVPKEGIDSVLKELTVANWSKWMDALKPEQGTIAIPKIKMEYENEMNGDLGTLGMGVAFTDKADFSAMSAGKGLQISKVKHKSFLQMDEQGTEAAAATSVEMIRTSAPAGFTFAANKPFLYAIVNDDTGTVIMLGVYRKPS